MRPHEGRAVASAVGTIGALILVFRHAPAPVRRLLKVTMTVTVTVLVAAAAWTLWYVFSRPYQQQEDAALVGLGAYFGVIALVIVGAAIVRRTVVRHMRWRTDADGRVIMTDGEGNETVLNEAHLAPPTQQEEPHR